MWERDSGRGEGHELVAVDGRRAGRGARGQSQGGEDGADGVGGFDDAEALHPVAALGADLRVDLGAASAATPETDKDVGE